MPRVNPLRNLTNERNLAGRIAFEREQRGWSYDGTARRMAESGHPMQASAIFKIEKGDPPRRITVDELVGFAAVFGTTTENLLQPLNVARRNELVRLLKEMSDAADQTLVADRNYKAALRALIEYRDANPEVVETLEDHGVDLDAVLAAFTEVDASVDEDNKKGNR